MNTRRQAIVHVTAFTLECPYCGDLVERDDDLEYKFSEAAFPQPEDTLTCTGCDQRVTTPTKTIVKLFQRSAARRMQRTSA